MSKATPCSDTTRQGEARRYWDREAASFDDEPDHGLRDQRVRTAWTRLLHVWLPRSPATILDAGCGTGSLSVVMAGLGHQVTGIDLSPAMIAQAQAKAAAEGRQVSFQIMDAAAPQLAPATFDVVVGRHILWALQEPAAVLARWLHLLKAEGRLILVEGFWDTGSGLHAGEIVSALRASASNIIVQDLAGRPEFWGKNVYDERFAIIADVGSMLA